MTQVSRTVLSLPTHPVFPVLIGVCCDMKPYLLVTMFYSNVRNGLYMSVCGLIVHCRKYNDIDILQWVTILLEMAEGLSLMHSRGFVHGNLTVENIITRKEKESPILYLLSF
jgi:serine/threonine protein kinase